MNTSAAAVGMVTPTWPSARSLQTTLAALRVNLINGFFLIVVCGLMERLKQTLINGREDGDSEATG